MRKIELQKYKFTTNRRTLFHFVKKIFQQKPSVQLLIIYIYTFKCFEKMFINNNNA